jgi:hypothetical protein
VRNAHSSDHDTRRTRATLATRIRSAIIVVTVISITIALAAVAYFTTLQQSQAAQQPVQVTWRDSSSNVITSITLGRYGQSRSVTVSFICSQSVGSVILKLSPSIANVVTLSTLAFSSCDGSLRYVTLAIPSIRSMNLNGTLAVVRSDLDTTLSGLLTINVQKS